MLRVGGREKGAGKPESAYLRESLPVAVSLAMSCRSLPYWDRM